MKIGLLSSEIKQRANTNELFEAIKKHGFESTQLSFSSVPELNFKSTGQIEFPEKVDDKIISVICAGAKKHGVEIPVCSGTFNMAHPEPEVREKGIRRFEALAYTAQKLSSKFISLCAGTRCRESLWVYHPGNSTPEAWADMMDTMKKCVKIAERYDIVLAVETEAATVVDTPEKARRMMDETGSGNLKMIMDCANLFHPGEAAKENVQKTIAHAFEIFGDDVVVAHGKDIAESDGIRFCPTGEGIVDYAQFVRLLKKHNCKGDILLHGIYDEGKLAYARKTIKKAMEE
ncbi:MAG: sugar phosphate isomerase/epimerase [Oscillospiraceae bacterium]|nr:sugar phosphate isomerase/epimerase [Oscillospiraceae bacterium]